jgi:hypothetical protein
MTAPDDATPAIGETAEAPKNGLPRLNTRAKQSAHLVATSIILFFKVLEVILCITFSILASLAKSI